MVVDLSWYARAYERAESSVTVTFSPYDLAPTSRSGGPIVVAGKFTAPDNNTRLTAVYFELVSGASNATFFTPVKPSWWTTGDWASELSLEDPIVLQLNLDAYTADDYDKTLAMSMMSWDGSPAIVRSSEPGIATSVLGMLNKIGTLTSSPFTSGGLGGLTGAPFTSAIWPQLHGTVADILKQIVSGTGITVWYSPNGTTIAGYASDGKQVIRLVNPEYSARTIVQPAFTPKVSMVCYNAIRGTNKVVYTAPDVIQVTSGENQDITVELDATPIFSGIVQPVAVGAIPTIPYTGPSSPYCVYDSDGFEAHNVWTAFGGKITVEAGIEPNEMIIHIIAPFDASNPTAAYTISELDNPALYVSAGDAAIYHKKTFEYPTGMVSPLGAYRPQDYQEPSVDNPVIVNQDLCHSRAVAFIAQEAEPQVSIETVGFDNAVLRNRSTGVESAIDPSAMAAATFRAHNSMWAFSSLEYTKGQGYSGKAVQANTVADFDSDYAGMTIADFQTYLATQYPDGGIVSAGTGTGQVRPGTTIASAALVPAPTLAQFNLEPLRVTTG